MDKELRSQFQDLLSAREDLHYTMWSMYKEADGETRMWMSGFLTGPDFQHYKDMERLKTGLRQTVLELEAIA